LNGDGTPDCVLASVALGGTVQVFLNKGGLVLADTGQLLPIRPADFYLWNFGIVLADVNRDGRLDLVTADAVRGANVYIGDGTGRFLPSSQVLWDQDVQEMKGLALGDFDDDGALDLAVGDYWAPGRVYFNDGFGAYHDSGQRLNFIRGWRIAVGDVNGDGYLDFVAANRDNQPLTVFLNDGTGHFTDSGQDLGVFDADDVKLADVNGDGYLDMIVAASIDQSTGRLSRVFFNDGHGHFTDSGQNLGTPNCETKEIGIGDLDNDGDLDLVLGDYNVANYVYLNDGKGNFVRQTWTLPSEKTSGATLVDLDGDGFLDVILAQYQAGVYKVFRNTGSLGKPNQTPLPPASLTSGVSAQTATLRWNDGSDAETPKVLLTYNVRVGKSPGAHDVVSGMMGVEFGRVGHAFQRVLKRLPVGTYYWSVQTVDTGYRRSSWAPEQSFAVTSAPDPIPPAAVTLNALTGPGAGQVLVSWSAPGDDGNTGTAKAYALRYATAPITDGTWPLTNPVLSVPVPSAAGTWQSVLVDGLQTRQRYYFALKTIDAAGNLSAISNSPSALAGSKEGLFTVAATTFEAANTERVAFADLNGDGALDLIQGNGGELEQPIAIYFNDGQGRFSRSAQTFPALFLRDIALGDIDGDGDLDLIVSGKAIPIAVWINDGTGRFTQSQSISVTTNVRAVKLADVDDDGDLDLLAGLDNTFVYFNDGKGHFTSSGQALGFGFTRTLAVGDVDGDGHLDFVQGNAIFQDWPIDNKVFLNDGAGRFVDSGQSIGNSDTCDVRLADINGDGSLDLWVGNSNNSANELYWNDGHGRFTQKILLGDPRNETKGLGVADLNNDGYPDLIAADWNGGVRIYANVAGRQVAPFGNALGPDKTNFVAVGDVDGDGDLDILAAVKGSPNVLYLNNSSDYQRNTPPTPPATLQSVAAETTANLSWDAGHDAETPEIFLTYNLRVGRTPGGNEVFSGAIPAGGGNTGHSFQKRLIRLAPGAYFWSVQTVDAGFARSAWAQEESFTVPGAAAGLPKIASVVNAGSYTPTVAPGGWATIFGQNLANTPASGQTWTAGDFNGVLLPTSLAGTSVQIDGRAAAVAFVSPSQLNVQVPDGGSYGTVNVQVDSPYGRATSTASVQPLAPALFTVLAGSVMHAAAVGVDGLPIGPPGQIPGARLAHPGEILQLFGTGFGETLIHQPAGQLVSVTPLLNSVTATVCGQSAPVSYAGLVGAGLNQINVAVPALSPGTCPVRLSVAEAGTQDGVVLAIGQ
jgi:uncharacterized protein (TIGR03437 family)